MADHTQLFKAKDLVAVISGGGSGVGKVWAHALVTGGAKAVYILGRREDALEECKASSSRPESIIPIVCDVTSQEALQNAAEQVRKTSGYCDLVVANAAIAEMRDSLLDMSSIQSIQEGLMARSVESYEEMYKTNTLGAFHTAIAFLALLDEGNKRAVLPQSSQVIFVSSATAYTSASFGVFGYPSSKAALRMISKQLAGILLPYKIRINTIIGGFYMTGMSASAINHIKEPTRDGAINGGAVPLERVGREEEVIGVMMFLASQAGAYVSGAELAMDGGMLAIPPILALPTPGPAASI